MNATSAGLSTAEARARQAESGRNDIESRDAHTVLQTLRSVASEPMFDLLLLAAAVYLVIGDLGEGLLPAFFALVTGGLVMAACAAAVFLVRPLVETSAARQRSSPAAHPA